jgi:hypothetical protein
MKQPSETSAKKKPYQSPKLLVYGDLTQMTKVSKKTGHPDGATSGAARRTGGG